MSSQPTTSTPMSPSLKIDDILDTLQFSPSPMEQNDTKAPAAPSSAHSAPVVAEQKSPETNRMPPRQPAYDPSLEQQNRLEEDLKVSYEASGILETTPAGYGFLRKNFELNPASDIYISPSQIKRFWLRKGDMIEGVARAPKNGERYHSLLLVQKINGKSMTEQESQSRTNFDNLTSVHPNRQIKLEYAQDIIGNRIVDMVSPIGFGQRALIVSQPKAGKTTFLREIAQGIAINHPEVHLLAILIGERPEEVTEIKRFIKGEVAASHFDEPPREQVKVANLALERARRLVEQGEDVVVLLDSITRLARAYNLAGPMEEASPEQNFGNHDNRYGRNRGQKRYGYQERGGDYGQSNRGSMSGGMSQSAMFPAKKFLGAARNCEEGGSLTIIGTALVGTESRMDDLIYEEFKGTGNMEIHLDRHFAEKRIFPAIDILKSGTRKEELLYDEATYKKIITLRRMLALLTPEEALTNMIEKLKKTKSNKEFLDQLAR
ncbi:MAG: transcription termination factor Rho [Candidatus Roizmanbacteria bacterium]